MLYSLYERAASKFPLIISLNPLDKPALGLFFTVNAGYRDGTGWFALLDEKIPEYITMSKIIPAKITLII
jgi:hypothetical protein